MLAQHRPDTVTVTREGWDDTEEKETAGALGTVYSEVSALIAPRSSGNTELEPGEVDEHRDLIFLAPLTDTTFYVIQKGDILTDDATSEVWIAKEPGVNYRNPSTFGTSVKACHTEVEVAKTDWG